MRKTIITFLFVVCGTFSSVCFGADYRQRETLQSNFANLKNVDKDFPNIFNTIENLFEKIFKKKKYFACSLPPSVTALDLNKTEILAGKNENQQIEVSTTTFADERLIFAYTVSGGKIIGEGAKVIWDLSGVKAGAYTITAAVDDGCGFCGMAKTQIINIKKCLDCKDE